MLKSFFSYIDKKIKDKMCRYAFENFKYVFDLFLLLIYVRLLFVPPYYVKLLSAKIKSASFKLLRAKLIISRYFEDINRVQYVDNNRNMSN